MTSTPNQSNSFLDPDISDWCDARRVDQIKLELLPGFQSLLWSQKLKPVVLAWVRRRLVLDLLRENSLWSVEEKAEIYTKKCLEMKNSPELSLEIPQGVADDEAWCLSEEVLAVWSRQQWGHRLETLYLAQKQGLDLVSCSLLRVKSQHMAFELSLRLKSNEASFDQLSWMYGEGPERNQGGRFVRQRMVNLPAALQPLLRKLKPGEVLKPHRLGDWFVIMSLEELLPAQYDNTTQDYLLRNELKIWLDAVSSHLVSQLQLVSS